MPYIYYIYDLSSHGQWSMFVSCHSHYKVMLLKEKSTVQAHRVMLIKTATPTTATTTTQPSPLLTPKQTNEQTNKVKEGPGSRSKTQL